MATALRLRPYRLVILLLLVVLMFYCGLLYACLLYIKDTMWHQLPSNIAYHFTIIPALLPVALMLINNGKKRRNGITIITLYATLISFIILILSILINFRDNGALITNGYWHISGLSFLLIHGLWIFGQLMISVALRFSASEQRNYRYYRRQIALTSHSVFFIMIYLFFEITG